MAEKKKIRTISTEEFHDQVLKLIRLSLRNLLFKFQISYKVEQDPEEKEKRLQTWIRAKKDLAQIEAVLDVAVSEEIESITVKAKSGKVYDCSTVTPLKLDDNELANLLIEFSKSVEK